MNRHQVLSGACNAGDRCYAVGSVEGIPFTAYAAGCNIVILASTFERVQIIPGATHGYIKISALDCSTDTGKIAAAYEDKICIFEPTPLIQTDRISSHNLDYRWVQTGTLSTSSHITSLSWNLEGTRLLTGGSCLQMWREKCSENLENESNGVKFEIGGGDRDVKTPTIEKEDETAWECVWSCQTATSVYHMAFSPDGTLFATSGRNDRLVKVWYENKHILFPTKSFDQSQFRSGTFDDTELSYSYVYIAHPRAVTNISWRKTSKYMPKGSVSNMLVTSCLDNICRIWIETVLPDDGLVNMTQFDPLASQNPKFRTHRHKHRFMQRLKHMKTCFHIRRHAKNGAIIGNLTSSIDAPLKQSPIPSLPSSYSVHDFHSYGFHGTGVTPGMHFHLAASINAETDIPLVPSMQTADPSNQINFILHWLNNKEMHFSLQAESILQELTKKIIDKEENNNRTTAANDNSHHSDETNNDTDRKEEAKKKFVKSVHKSFSIDESNSDEHSSSKHSAHHGHHGGISNVTSMSNTTSLNSLGPDNPASGHVVDSLDMKIDCLLRDWHHSPDLLYSVHPIDGSYLIWVIEWLDDYYPGSFRQAQVSFSTRIPSAFPLGDAMSMSTTVNLYNTGSSPLHFRDMVKSVKKQEDISDDNPKDAQSLSVVSEEQELDDQQNTDDDNANQKNKEKQYSENRNNSTEECVTTTPSPTVSMVTKHSNGTINLWQLTFAYKTKFTQVLSIGHVWRASGHRFRVNDITCHPVLPLLVTTSHHNLPDSGTVMTPQEKLQNFHKDIFAPTGFCSELILWRVDAVGPLSHSGGVSELARINSPEISAFSNVAWIPTLLPSTTLGSYSNSPSACFVASDGENLRLYQAVIDARTLLAEISSSEMLSKKVDSMASLNSDASSDNPFHRPSLHDKIKIVSQQSTARPGCIIQLDAIADATHDWQNTQFLHVFQEQLITGDRSEKQHDPDDPFNQPGFMESELGAMVDLHRNAEFEEPFYIVIIEKTIKGSTIHMWRIVIASKPQTPFLSESAMYVPDSNLTQELDEPEIARRMSIVEQSMLENTDVEVEAPHISIVTMKVCTQELPLPDGVDVIHASPAAGHLSSSSIYPACFAPYTIVTACSDSISRFWQCEVSNTESDDKNATKFEWAEWKMLSRKQESAIEISGQPLNISAAYSGRVACAYKYGKSFTRPHKGDPDSRYINLCVAIYECESTGGSEWVLEDTIHLRNIHLPRINIDQNLDLSYLHDNKYLQKKHRLNQVIHTFTAHEESRSPRSGDITPELTAKPSGLLAVPSFSTLQSLRKSITENGNTCPLTQKHLVQLDWVSKEDGSHILTVAVGSKILLYTPVSSDLAQANMKAMKESRSTNRPLLRKASSLAQPHFNDEIRWMKLRQIDLQTADGLPPLPMQISWVRDGILVVGMDSEMHVYSQWKPHFAQTHSVEDMMDTRNLRDEDLRSLANESTQRRLNNVQSMPHMSKASTANLQLLSAEKKKKFGNVSSSQLAGGTDNSQFHDYMTDYGLFQASRIACPVLPQYHPKQLMELLNSGKIRWVKAILAHLVRCMSGPYMKGAASGDNDSTHRQRAWSRSRTLSISYIGAANSPNEQRGSTTQIPEELMLDYAEITSIPPLPLWVLLSADKEGTGQIKKQKEEVKDYDELFDLGNTEEDNLDELLDIDSETRRADRRQSIPEKQGVAQFGPRQGQLLSRLLTHTHLPDLSSLDQMHLLALADTVATCNTDFSDKFAIDAAKRAIAKENSAAGNDAGMPSESLDDCGLRFLLAMKHFSYLLRCLPLTQRNQFQKQGVGTSNIVWAFHSENEDELLNLIPSYTKGQLKWSTLKELGVGYWLKNTTTLKTCFEKLAKSAYQSKQDPLDAALYYLAMKKKSIVWGLFRSQRDEKMTKFFANNFSEDRWRKAALKNAFVLLGKQRFDHAVAFFLLANSLMDAIEVCLNKLDDFQLALVIARLYEGELDSAMPSTYKKLLYDEILGCDPVGNNQDISKAHPDPFLRSIAYWLLKNYSGSLNTLLLNNVGQNHHAYREEDYLKAENSQSTNPNVFNFYIYLRTHPLLIRQHIASTAQEKKMTQVVLSGFSYTGDNTAASAISDKQLQLEDTITPLERQLYFTTAHGHFKAGCPALALEVLNKLPTKVIESAINSEVTTPSEHAKDDLIKTGMLDWGAPNPVSNSSVDLDWGASANASVAKEAAASFDWSAPVNVVKEEAFKIQWDEDEKNDEDDSNTDGDVNGDNPNKESPKTVPNESEPVSAKENQMEKLDIMAQQLKFVACLKILMEELSTLATGFEVDGGQLRYQLYIWLEREVDALKQLCNYCNAENEALENNQTIEMSQMEKDNNFIVQKTSEKPTLHEILMQEKQDFEAKVKRAARRKRWLKANETLLRTLLSYCSLHGASGGGLASVRMELVLLLQELQQEKTQQQLLSPLPFPTTLPLLSACVAGNKTVIADPIKYLQAQTQDMLQTVVGFRSPYFGVKEDVFCEIFVLRDLAVALSSCIYQSLCDSESFVVSQSLITNGYQSPGIENLAKLNASCQCSHLMVNANIFQRKRKYSTDEPASICTLPSKWPGVTNLRALLAREKDEDIPRLTVLLLEAFVATYMSLMVYALASCDCHILYRLVGQKFSNESWASLFGGGIKKLLRKATSQSHPAQQNLQSQNSQDVPDESSVWKWNTVTSMTKQRVKLNMKLLGNLGSSSSTSVMKEDKPTYREQFVPPEMSMVSYFLIKPPVLDEEDYDSDDSYASEEEEPSEDEDVFGETLTTAQAMQKNRKENIEHLNPKSYSWNIMRLAIIKLTALQLHEVMNIAGIENQELPVASPLSHGVLRTLNHWQEILTEEIASKGPVPNDYIPGCFVENEAKGPAIHKYRSLLEKHNTPFIPNSSSAGPARRLWNYLVRQESVQDVFIRAIFGKKRSKDSENTMHPSSKYDPDVDNSLVEPNSQQQDVPEPIRIIHKDQESISAFCINNASSGLMSIATPRELQEMDISLLLESPNWYEDECEYDILNLSKDIDSMPATGFLVIQTPSDKNVINQNSNVQNYGSPANMQPTVGSQSGRGTSVVLKHKVDNVKRMCAHPLMPLYLTGGQDGSVQLWEWGHQQVVCTPRPPGTFAKVTRCRFSQQGNKFGIADGDGILSLWQAGMASQTNKSFFTYQCHNKIISDFVFLGSCSLVASAGHSSENKNVGIWDTLLSQKKSLVSSFACHDQGASSLIYAPQHQVLISSGKKGDVCIFDVRQRTLRHRFQAHESAIKCMAMDPHEELFVTGSAEGDIKIWGLTHHVLMYSFPGEHAKSSFFKHSGQGVSQLQLDSQGRLFSCGSDGSMKVRQLPDREMIVQSLY